MTTTPEPPASPEPPETPAAPTPPAEPAPPPTVPSPPTATAPPPGYAAPAPATAGASGSGGGLAVSPVALAVCVIGAVLVIVSIFLNWADVSIGGQTFTANGREVPLDFLWDKDSTSEDPSLIVALIPAALLVGLGALKRLRWLALVGGILAVVVAVLFGYQIDQGLQDLPPEADISLFDFIGIAPWFALGGGLLGMIGAGVPRPSTSA